MKPRDVFTAVESPKRSDVSDPQIARARFKITQTLAICISLLALSISVASFYYQFFYVSEELRATVMSSDLRERKWYATLVFVNNGTRPALLQDVSLEVVPLVEDTNPPPVRVTPSISITASESLPVTIKAKEIAVLTLSCDFDPMKYYSMGSLYKEVRTGPFRTTLESRGARQLQTSLRFTALNSRGKYFQQELPDLTITITQDDYWQVCGSSGTVDLFSVAKTNDATVKKCVN